ncbi:hypothetical protein PGT21_035729 [Puccinia graminis f. sp. tritici]|uniref:Uncharacterized protein n=1 Tax=Puccinia graminis f. sp. tritici TaxID=56615 RepID=A0A5B0PN43_PUCGR|nr:hypothetical protein PGT21_035729 [Puccinia graminis f. sp. tritici]
MSASSDVVHDQVSVLSRGLDHLGTEPVTHSPKQEAPPVSTDGNSGEAESFEFEVLTPYDQESEGVLESLDVGGSAEVFPSSAHVGHGASIMAQNTMVDFSRLRRHGAALRQDCNRRLAESIEPLIADASVATSRLVMTRTHCLYPKKSTLIPFPSCLIGFRLILHPCDPKARIKHVKIELTLNSKEAEPTGSLIAIKSIYPPDGEIQETGERTLVHAMRENSAGISVGVDPYGTATLKHVQSVGHNSYTVPYVLSSGVDTNILLITMEEDSSLKAGVAPSLYFAALLELPTDTKKSFHAHMKVVSKSHKHFASKPWPSPMAWSFEYDGQTEFGKFGTHWLFQTGFFFFFLCSLILLITAKYFF